MKTPKVSGALRQAPDPMPRYAHFAKPDSAPLRYVGKIGRTRAGAPLDQILDPLLKTATDVPNYKGKFYSQFIHLDIVTVGNKK